MIIGPDLMILDVRERVPEKLATCIMSTLWKGNYMKQFSQQLIFNNYVFLAMWAHSALWNETRDPHTLHAIQLSPRDRTRANVVLSGDKRIPCLVFNCTKMLRTPYILQQCSRHIAQWEFPEKFPLIIIAGIRDDTRFFAGDLSKSVWSTRDKPDQETWEQHGIFGTGYK